MYFGDVVTSFTKTAMSDGVHTFGPGPPAVLLGRTFQVLLNAFNVLDCATDVRRRRCNIHRNMTVIMFCQGLTKY